MFMPLHLIPAETQPTDPREPDAAYYRGVLHAVIDMGVDLARMVHRQAEVLTEAAAQDPAAPGPGPDLVMAFDRVARTVRRTVLLAQKIGEPGLSAKDPGRRRAATRRQIIRAVEDQIQRDAYDDEAERLHAEFAERLDRPELDEDIDDDRPAEAIIADISRDLGLAALPGTNPWKRRSPRDVAVLCARARGGWADDGLAMGGVDFGSGVADFSLLPDKPRFRGS